MADPNASLANFAIRGLPMPELRKDPIVGRWVIIATDRAKRPEVLKVQPQSLAVAVVNYVTNHVVNRMPSYRLRHAWYRRHDPRRS